MLLLTLSQTLLDLLKSETTHRFDREEMRVHACLYIKKKEKGVFFASYKFLCLSWVVNSSWKIWEENITVLIEISVA